MFNGKLHDNGDRRTAVLAHATGDSAKLPSVIVNMIKRSGRFIWVGTSGLINLGFICSITESIKQNLINNHIPKLFIIDNSIHVEKFWHLMKELIINTNSLAELEKNVSERQHDIDHCTNKSCNDIGDYLKLAIKVNKNDVFLSDQDMFEYIKRIITEATIIYGDMRNQYYFECINKLNTENIPVGVFASNVIELLGTHDICVFDEDADLDDKYYKEWQKTSMKCVVDNISYLNPTFAIHLRTTKASSDMICLSKGEDPNKNFHPSPDRTFLMVRDGEYRFERTLENLSGEKFIPLVITPLPINDEPSNAEKRKQSNK